MTLFGTVTNLSVGGLFLRTVPVVAEGSDVEIRLSLGQGIVTGRGAVRWRAQPTGVGPEGRNTPPGMGIQLVQISEGRDLLETFVSRTSLVPEP